MGDPVDHEDTILSRVTGLSLSGALENHATVVFLRGLAQELEAEGTPTKLTAATVERALMDRLSNPPPGAAQWPVHYLLGCYARATELRDKETALQSSLDLVRQLAVSYASLVLFLDLFPQPEEAQKRGRRQLLDALEAGQASTAYGLGPAGQQAALPGNPTPMPPGFLDDLHAHMASQEQEAEWMALLSSIGRYIILRAGDLSVLGDFQSLVQLATAFLGSSVAVQRSLAALPEWGTASEAGRKSGRGLESNTILGSLFSISGVPDIYDVRSRRRPSIVDECFPPGSESRPAEVRDAVLSLQSAAGLHHAALHGLLMALLRSPACREATLQWLTMAVRLNNERAKMHPDPALASSDGFMINLTAVLLRMCEPFMGMHSHKAWSRLDPRYLSDPEARASLALDETRVAATEPEVAAWLATWRPAGAQGDQAAAGAGPAPTTSGYHFIADVFFMTARSLGVGYAKTIDNLKSFGRRLQNYEDAVAELEGQLQRMPQHPLIQTRLRQYQGIIRQIKGADGAYQAALLNPALISNVLSFYQLLTTFVLRIADPRVAAGEPCQLPLPEKPSMEFRQLPEAWIENLTEVLALATHARGRVIQPAAVEDFILFITICLSSPAYIKNPYLRGQLVMVLHELMPPPDSNSPGGLGASRALSGTQAETAALFQAHPLVIENMVKSLIHLYVDIELTDRHNTFYEKFTVRYQIGEIMAYLWQLPQHHAAWRAVATSDEYTYVRFVNMMINDSQFLLQEALETLPRVQEVELQMADEAAWAARPAAERAELEEQLSGDHGRLKGDFYLASVCVSTMLFTAEDEVVGALFFEPQVRDRQARILNFFLKYLTVPGERKKLKVRDPSSLHWDPKRLVLELGRLHVSLYRRRPEGWVAANVADTDYLGNCPAILAYLLGVLRHLGTMPADEVADLQRLADEIEAARVAAAEEEAAMEDVPADFEDPLMGTLMRDPVRLPSGNVVDRATIMQQLLTDRRDPFSRAPMTEQDVEPLPELQAAIQHWLADQRAKRLQGGATGMEQGGL